MRHQLASILTFLCTSLAFSSAVGFVSVSAESTKPPSLVATIGGTQGVYRIPVSKITRAEVIGTDLRIDAPPSKITIGSIDTRDALRNLTYLQEVMGANDLKKTLGSRQRYRVVAGSSIQSAIEAAIPGDVLEIEPGMYDESLILKDRVDLVFLGSGSSVVSHSDAPTLKLTNNAVVHIYGRASFYSMSGNPYATVVMNGPSANGRLFLQFASLIHDGGRVVTWESGQLYLLGDRISTSGEQLAPFDWDYSADVIDVDVSAIDSATSAIFICCQTNPESDLYFRNARMTSRSTSVYSGGNDVMPRLVLASVEMVSTPSAGRGNIDLWMDEIPIDIHMWNVRMTSEATSQYSIQGAKDIHLTLHTDVVADSPVGPTVSLSGPGHVVLMPN